MLPRGDGKWVLRQEVLPLKLNATYKQLGMEPGTAAAGGESTGEQSRTELHAASNHLVPPNEC